MPPLTNSCCQVSQSRTPPTVRPPIPGSPCLFQFQISTSTSSVSRRRAVRADGPPDAMPPPLQTLTTPALLILVLLTASAVSCSSLPPEDGIRVVSAEKRVCFFSSCRWIPSPPHPLSQICDAGCLPFKRTAGTVDTFLSFRDYANLDAFLLHIIFSRYLCCYNYRSKSCAERSN